jgi:ATP-dependent RNA helicase DeaD
MKNSVTSVVEGSMRKKKRCNMENINFRDFGLDKSILDAIDKLGYTKPSEVQEQVVPLALKGKDLIVKSQTGSGKTAAFGIPVCEKLDIEERRPQVLVLTPTRELCVQVKDDISNLGRFKKVKCAAIFGKQPYADQVRALKQRTHVVVGTPGRTMDHIERGTLDLTGIKYFIIDEADEMLKMGFIDQVEAIIKSLPKDKVTMLFSATMPHEIGRICDQYMKDPQTVEISPENVTAENIRHIFFWAEEDKKFSMLLKLLYSENPESGIIFLSTKDRVGHLAGRLKKHDIPCEMLHGGMLQNERLDVINRFRRGEFMFLVTTDVAARGIDIENISLIVNYDVPMERERYVHRIGRTARAGSKGTAVTLVSTREEKFLRAVEEYIGARLEKGEHPTEEQITKGKEAFLERIKSRPKLKTLKGAELNKDITKIYLGAGKKKKMRPGDIVGAITSIPDVTVEDIGIIDIQETHSYVDIMNKKGLKVIDGLKKKTIKGKIIKVQKAEK